MAAWAGWAKIKTLLETAGATVTPAITLVDRGAPSSMPQDMIRFWYDGNVSSPVMSDTLNRSQEGIALTIGVFLKAGAPGIEAEARLDERLEEIDAAIQSALLGDAYLGDFGAGTNTTVHLLISDTSAAFGNIGGAAVRALEIPVVYTVADRHTIGA